MLTEPNVLFAAESIQRINRPTTSLSSSAIGTIGVGGGAVNNDSFARDQPPSYLSHRHQESF
jgi:hypothetical protein